MLSASVGIRGLLCMTGCVRDMAVRVVFLDPLSACCAHLLGFDVCECSLCGALHEMLSYPVISLEIQRPRARGAVV